MTSMKKTYTAAFKAQVALELLKETKTTGQRASEDGVHPNRRRAGRDRALTDLPSLFATRDSRTARQATHAQQLEERDAAIGRLTPQVNGLKKRRPS